MADKSKSKNKSQDKSKSTDKKKDKNQDQNPGEEPEPQESAAAKVFGAAKKNLNGASTGSCWKFVDKVLKDAKAQCFHDINKGIASYAFKAETPWGKGSNVAKTGYVAVFVGTEWWVERAIKPRGTVGSEDEPSWQDPYRASFSEKGHVGIVLKKSNKAIVLAGQNVKQSWKDKNDGGPAKLEIPLTTNPVLFANNDYIFRMTLIKNGPIYYFMPLKFSGDRHACDPPAGK